MDWSAVRVGAAALVAGFVFASLVEYWGHRAMHAWRWLGKVHWEHHGRGTGQGVVGEYFDYVRGTWWLMLLPFLASLPVGIGWLLGANVFAFFSAFSHQLQHEAPEKVFWMPMPTHYVHHALNQWHHNFGMALDIWDRVFGTYKPLEWNDAPHLPEV
jgi:sterol desaturase/sphingolipid hydroxylase (fatty acid hydroxylase superfamily)